MWEWNDDELLVYLSNNVPWFSYNAFGKVWEYGSAVAFHISGHEGKEVVRGKMLASLPMQDERFATWYGDVRNIQEAEREIARELGIPPEAILIATSGDPKRMIAQEVNLFTARGQHTGTVFEAYPRHKAALEDLADGFVAWRVCARTEYREKVFKAAEYVSEVLHDLIS